MTNNDVTYYESSKATVSDAQGDLARNTETVNHTININFEKKKIELPDHTCFPPLMKTGIYQGITAIKLTPQTLLIPAKKKASQTWSWAARGRPGLIGELVGMASTEAPHATLVMLLA